MVRFPILMYHRIVSGSCPVPEDDADERRYAVTLDEFRRQLDEIEAAGKRGVSMERVHDTLESGAAVPREWVAITFDDGNRSDFEHARPLLVQRGWDATFYVCGNRLGVPGGLEREMIGAMVAEGLHIGGHGMTHRFLATLSGEEESRELEESRLLLGGITGKSVDHFAPPGGRYSPRTLRSLVGLGYRAVATSDFGFNRGRGARLVYRRVAVMATSSRGRFRRLLAADPLRVLPDYARAGALRAAKAVLGESGYRRVRSRGLGS